MFKTYVTDLQLLTFLCHIDKEERQVIVNQRQTAAEQGGVK